MPKTSKAWSAKAMNKFTMYSSGTQTQALLSSRWLVAAILTMFFVYNPVAKADEECLTHIMTEDGPDISGFDTTLLLKTDVSELEEVGEQLYVVVWDEDVSDPTIPNDSEFTTYFEITLEPMNMTVSVKKTPEGLPDYPASTNELKILVEFPPFTSATGCTLELNHNILDENTEHPTPEEESYEVTVREDFPVGVTLYGIEVKVTDNDRTDPNNKFSVTVDPDCPLEATEQSYTSTNGNPSVVQFQLRSSLDYESAKKNYDCQVQFTDKGSPPLSRSTSIAVIVQDMPDEPPVFTSSYYYAEALSTTASNDPLVISPNPIKATDGDTGIDAPITYSMDNARPDVDGVSYFTLDAKTGDVTLTMDLDDDILVYERVSFIITAQDDTTDTSTSVLEVTLPPLLSSTTTDQEATCPPCPTTCPVVTCPPVTCPTSDPSLPSLTFEKDSYAGEIYAEFHQVYQVRVEVKGISEDSVVFSWVNGADDENFDIDSNNGMITTKKNDIAAGNYELIAVAFSTETEPPLEAEAQVKIVVLSPSDGDLTIFSSVVMTQVDEGDPVATEPLAIITTSKDAGSVCITTADPEEAYDKFEMVKEDNKWEVQQKKALNYEEWKQISLRLKAFDDEGACTGPSTSSDNLLRNEAMVMVSVTDRNDEAPVFQVPPADEVIAYPKDTALQSVVGPVITLKATDPDTIGKVTYELSGDGAAGFQVGSDSGAVYVKGKFECSSGCLFTAKAKDEVTETAVKITVVELDMNHIFTLTMDNIDVTMVDDVLHDLSNDIGAQVSKLYVGPSVSASTQGARSWFDRYFSLPATGILRWPPGSDRGKRDTTTLSIQVHVYTVKLDGSLMDLQEFRDALQESDSEMEAQGFTEKQVFTQKDQVDTTGLTVAVAVLGVLLGVVLLSGIAFFIYRRRKEGRAPPASPISTLGRAYPNQGYTSDTTERQGKSLYDSIDLNGSVKGGGDDPGTPTSSIRYTSPLLTAAAVSSGDSPPLYRSALSQKPDPAPSSTSGSEAARGLRRTDPGKPEYYGLSSPSAPPSFERTTTVSPPAATSSSSMSSYSDAKPSSSSGLYPTIVTMNHDENKSEGEKLPMSTFTTKEDNRPREPAADYETVVDGQPSTSKFGGLKGSPPPKRSNHDSDDDDTDEDKTTDDEGKKSVAFKVMVDTKEIEPENMGPAQKKAAAKSNAMDILEANKKKMEEEGEEDDDDDDDNDDHDHDDIKL